MSIGIEIQNISKRYSNRIAVDGLSLKIQEGEIFGFVGPNGAGKTTTIRMLCGLLKPDQGEVYIGGISVQRNPREIRRLIGYMPDEFGVYPDLQAWEYLDFFAACYGLNSFERAGQIDNLLELVDLQHRKFDPVDKLSRGMKQRLSLARVLLHNPQFLILDEPASGLDPRARIEIRELLLELAEMRSELHCHSTLSDGKLSIRQMAEGARARALIAEREILAKKRREVEVFAKELKRRGYRVAAINLAGQSAYSNLASASVPAT